MASIAPEPAAGSATRARFELFQEHKLGVARGAAGERIRQAERGGMRQYRDGIGAAKAGGGHGDRRRSIFT